MLRIVIFTVVVVLFGNGLPVMKHNACLAAEPLPKASERSRKDLVMISMRPNVHADSNVIRLGDVANISGGDAAFREQLKQLDLDDAVSPGESISILPPQVEFRLRIAGIDVERISIRGTGTRVTARPGTSNRDPETVTRAVATSGRDEKSRRAVDFSSISADEGPLEREIIRAAKTCVLAKLPWSAENVDIRLSQPVSLEIRQISSAAGYQCSAEMRTSGPALGRVQVRVIAEASQKPTFDIPVILEVRHFEKVVLVTKSIERGHVLTAADLFVDRQDVTELSDYCSTTNELIGTAAKRSIRALLPVRLSDVEPQGRSENSILIKRREHVKMIARVGGLTVSATGESLEDGRLGDTIRLRNIASNANVQGRVIGHGEVEISF